MCQSFNFALPDAFKQVMFYSSKILKRNSLHFIPTFTAPVLPTVQQQ